MQCFVRPSGWAQDACLNLLPPKQGCSLEHSSHPCSHQALVLSCAPLLSININMWSEFRLFLVCWVGQPGWMMWVGRGHIYSVHSSHHASFTRTVDCCSTRMEACHSIANEDLSYILIITTVILDTLLVFFLFFSYPHPPILALLYF